LVAARQKFRGPYRDKPVRGSLVAASTQQIINSAVRSRMRMDDAFGRRAPKVRRPVSRQGCTRLTRCPSKATNYQLSGAKSHAHG
jgi:hypothetical protein